MPNEPKFDENSVQILGDLIQERTGLLYENSRTDLLIDRLTPLVVERGLESFLDYYYLF
jgi:chemotaxis protein methyltransferase CheR